MWQIAVDCRQIAVRLLSRGRSLIAESVEIGGRMQGVTGVSRNTLPKSNLLILYLCFRKRVF